MGESASVLFMTLERAKIIAEHVTNVFATKPRNKPCSRSQLRGYSYTEIYRAFALVIAARRQIEGDDIDPTLGCSKYADAATTLILSFTLLPWTVLPDEDAEKLSKLLPDSTEYKQFVVQLVNNWSQSKERELQDLSEKEMLTCFNEFCWGLSHEDSLY